MTEEQRQNTLGQIVDMREELQNNINNLVHDFMNKTGAVNVTMSAEYSGNKVMTDKDEVKDEVVTNYIYVIPRFFK